MKNRFVVFCVSFAAAAEGFGFRRRFRPWKMEIPGRVCTLSLAVVRNRRRPKERKNKLSLFFFFFFFFSAGPSLERYSHPGSRPTAVAARAIASSFWHQLPVENYGRQKLFKSSSFWQEKYFCLDLECHADDLWVVNDIRFSSLH